MSRAKLFAAAAVLLGLSATAAAAQSAPFDQVVVFGDSLSDNGDLSASLGLPRLRFTTNPGLVAVEDIAQRYGFTLQPSLAGGSDYAYGGAGLIQGVLPVPTLGDQVSSYLGAHGQADPHALYSIWGGANDIFAHDASIAAGTQTLQTALPQVVAAAQLEGQLLDRLQSAGARTIIVFNLPDIGLTPGGLPQDTTMVQAFNAQLNTELKGRHGVVPVNTYLALHETIANPAAAGFSNVTSPACTSSTALLCTPQTLVQPDAASTHLFADDVHPTTAGHLRTAELVSSELTAPGQMSLLAEAPLALLRGHRAAVREQLDAAPGAGQGWTLFASGRAGERRLDGDWAAPSAKSDEDAITVGGVWRSGAALRLGFALTAGQSRVRMEGDLGGFDARELAVSAFGQYDWASGAWASAQAGFGVTNYDDISRSFVLGPAMRTERSTSHGHDDSFELALGQWRHVGSLRTGPFAAFSYDRMHVGDAAEVAGDATSMWFGPQRRESSVTRVGWSLRGETSLMGFALQPVATVAYGHDFQADRRLVTAGLTTMTGDFSLPGYLPSKNWGEATLGLGADLGRGIRASLTYQGRYGDEGHENLGALGVSYSF
jgi:outer membrane lipase/esterase